jgi:hypothetical protein
MPFNLLGIARASPTVADAVGWNLSEAPENRRTRRPKDRTVATTASNRHDVEGERCVRVANVSSRCASTFSLRTVAHANWPRWYAAPGSSHLHVLLAHYDVNDRRARSSRRRSARENNASPFASRLGLEPVVVTSVDRDDLADLADAF